MHVAVIAGALPRQDAVSRHGNADGGWLAALSLGFAERAGRTVIAEPRHTGPLRLLRSFHPESTPCHSYLIHPPGGIVGWELTCLGRPASGERFGAGVFRQRLEVFRSGKPLLLERNRFAGGAGVLDGTWGLGGHSCLATLVAYAGDRRVFGFRGEVMGDL